MFGNVIYIAMVNLDVLEKVMKDFENMQDVYTD